MTESESVALPLGDTPTEMGWIVGFEPTHNGATTRCLNHLTIPTAFVEATPGFEPGNKGFADLCLTTWLCRHKRGINFPRKKLAIRNGLEPSTSSVTGWHSNQLNYRTAMIVVGATGLEPVTPCL